MAYKGTLSNPLFCEICFCLELFLASKATLSNPLFCEIFLSIIFLGLKSTLSNPKIQNRENLKKRHFLHHDPKSGKFWIRKCHRNPPGRTHILSQMKTSLLPGPLLLGPFCQAPFLLASFYQAPYYQAPFYPASFSRSHLASSFLTIPIFTRSVFCLPGSFLTGPLFRPLSR